MQGHGPASHLWTHFSHDGGAGAKWEHENSSCDMIDLIIKGWNENNVVHNIYCNIMLNLEKKIDIKKYDLEAQDLVFIKVRVVLLTMN